LVGVIVDATESLALDELGWHQFFDLCAGVLELDAGIAAGAWTGEDDRDRHVIASDGLVLSGHSPLPGPCYVQAVWVPDRGELSRAVALKDQLRAIRDALPGEQVGSVLVLTNYPGVFSDRARLREFFGVDQAVLLGPVWLSARVDASPRLRRSMPSLLGLGDLDRWVPAGARTRSTLDVGVGRELAAVFVPTCAYARAVAVLEAHRFAVLTGPPEMGKTSIARMIALSLMTDGWEAFESTTPEEVVRVFDAGRSQVFVADDAFGSTEYRPGAAERWAREMGRLLRMMDDRHWLIWTSRPTPLRAGLGRVHSERGAERFPQPGEVLIDASALSLDEKVLILLRHAKARSPESVRQGLRTAGYAIVSHAHFTPERIRRLVSSYAGALGDVDSYDFQARIEEQIRTPTEAMAASFRALSDEHQALLFALLDAPPGPVEERDLAHLARRHRPEGLSSAPMQLVDRLTDHFLRVSDTLKVDWVHPSWRDLVIDRLREDGHARGAFLKRCTLEGVMLAISTAGGPSGGRTLALLVTDRDWDLVTDQVVHLIREAGDGDVTRLLDAIAAAIRAASERGSPEAQEARAVAASALQAVSRRCDQASGPIDLDVLTAWFELARQVPVPMTPPCLDRTWTELLPSETTNLRVQIDLDQAVGWLDLADLLRAHDPEQLGVYGFPERHRERIHALLVQAEALVATQSPGACSPELVRLLRLGRRHGTEAPSTLAHYDAMIWSADEEQRQAAPLDPIGTDASIRRHVERILEDL
jgi:hypothetical protein